MDSFTSWLGLLGQCSTMLNGCQAPLERGMQQERRSIKCWILWDIWGQPVSSSGWLAWMSPLLSSPNVLQAKFYLTPNHKGWVYFTVPIWHFFGASLGIYILPCLYHCSFPTRTTAEKQLPTQLVEEDQHFINSSLWWTPRGPTSQTTSLQGTLLASSVKGPLGRTMNTSRLLWPSSRLPLYLTCQWFHLSAPPQSPILQMGWRSGSSSNAISTLHWGDFAHSAASSPEPHSKGECPGSNTS